MRLRRRPWAVGDPFPLTHPVRPSDSLVLELEANEALPRASAPLPGLSADGALFHELPLPSARNGILAENFPQRPRLGIEPHTEEEDRADRALNRMIQTLARVHELEFASDEPLQIWDRLDAFWRDAEEEDAILVSEIVRQANTMPKLLERLMRRLRRVLRRDRDRVALDRVQEMDTGSLIWLTKQPGRTLAERAGSDQRIQAVVRRESFDTGENRVLRAWCELAAAEARDWLRHNRRAKSSDRYRDVDRLGNRAKREARTLEELGVKIARPGMVPNFVLTQDPDYRRVQEAWVALLREKREIDDLWSWQGRTWSDFVALAVTLSLRNIPGAELVASCPLAIFSDHDRGAWFAADVPLAVFHLRNENLIIEVQYRPRDVTAGQDRLAAPLWLRIGGLTISQSLRRLPVWPRLIFDPVSLDHDAAGCASAISGTDRRLIITRGLVVASDPSEGMARVRVGVAEGCAIGIGPSGTSLRQGMISIGEYLRDEIHPGNEA